MSKRNDGTTIWIHHDTKRKLNEIKENLELSGYSESYNDIIYTLLIKFDEMMKNADYLIHLKMKMKQ